MSKGMIEGEDLTVEGLISICVKNGFPLTTRIYNVRSGCSNGFECWEHYEESGLALLSDDGQFSPTEEEKEELAKSVERARRNHTTFYLFKRCGSDVVHAVGCTDGLTGGLICGFPRNPLGLLSIKPLWSRFVTCNKCKEKLGLTGHRRGWTPLLDTKPRLLRESQPRSEEE